MTVCIAAEASNILLQYVVESGEAAVHTYKFTDALGVLKA